ncbi:MAG: hypothetical protein IKH52_01700, partial [Bacteroidaceae bacterium]|nr:hypothetical protein [Bacteroidaceae bacterium]
FEIKRIEIFFAFRVSLCAERDFFKILHGVAVNGRYMAARHAGETPAPHEPRSLVRTVRKLRTRRTMRT